MEQITETVQQVAGQVTQTGSEQLQTRSQQSTARIPTRAEVDELYKLYTRIRLCHNWNAQTFNDAEPTLLVWFERFQKYDIPAEAYNGLFNRAFDVRQEVAREQGISEAPIIDAALLVSCWTGKHGLRAKWEKDRIESGRYIENSLLGTCRRCHGTKIETVYDASGVKLGSRPGCKHEPVVEGDGLSKFEESQRQKEVDRRERQKVVPFVQEPTPSR